LSLESWLAFCLTETVLCLSPGPAVLLVVSTSLGRGLRPGAGAALGILAANALYFVLSATGVAAVLVTSSLLFEVLRWVGAIYLVALGLRMLLARASAAKRRPGTTLERSFLRGFVVQGANPKALLFFVALLPQFIDPGASIAVQLWILGASSILIELAALALYAWVAVRTRRVAGGQISGWLERVGGGLLVAAGLRLAGRSTRG